ncbi:hypothetical protein FB451DRAFT_1447733 [Mycena latifolia]|nr:hypothetical protein FB451DRAFT_1447733 [Mycena latifolia]
MQGSGAAGGQLRFKGAEATRARIRAKTVTDQSVQFTQASNDLRRKLWWRKKRWIVLALCAAAAVLGVVDSDADKRAGAIAVLDPGLELDAEDAEAGAEVDDKMNDGKEGEVGCVVAQSCSTSASAKVTSAEHAVRQETREAAGAKQKKFTVTSEEQFAAASRYDKEGAAHAPHDETPLNEGSAAELDVPIALALALLAVATHSD